MLFMVLKGEIPLPFDLSIFLNSYRMRFLILVLIISLHSCKPEKKYHDTKVNDTSVHRVASLSGIATFQEELNEEFKNPETSPLPDRFRKDFESLDFFEADTTLIIQASLVRTPDALPFDMPTNTERKSREVVYGVAHFSLNGRPQQLEIYQNKELMQQKGYEDYLFLPFTDATNGETTYEGGRYLDLKIPNGSTIELDFNKAYNPYCAYNKKYSCPLVPAVNNLGFKIEAGVKAFKMDSK